MANLYKNHLFKKAVEEARAKIFEHSPPKPEVIKYNWFISREKIIYSDNDISMTMHPFTMVETYSSFARNLKQIDESLELLRRFMYKYIDLKCPKV